jgi:riboflavin biosynthesis pyrimidine reductase
VIRGARQLRDDAAALAENARTVIEDGPAAALRSAEEARARQAESPREKAIDSTPEVPTLMPRGGRRK